MDGTGCYHSSVAKPRGRTGRTGQGATTVVWRSPRGQTDRTDGWDRQTDGYLGYPFSHLRWSSVAPLFVGHLLHHSCWSHTAAPLVFGQLLPLLPVAPLVFVARRPTCFRTLLYHLFWSPFVPLVFVGRCPTCFGHVFQSFTNGGLRTWGL